MASSNTSDPLQAPLVFKGCTDIIPLPFQTSTFQLIIYKCFQASQDVQSTDTLTLLPISAFKSNKITNSLQNKHTKLLKLSIWTTAENGNGYGALSFYGHQFKECACAGQRVNPNFKDNGLWRRPSQTIPSPGPLLPSLAEMLICIPLRHPWIGARVTVSPTSLQPVYRGPSLNPAIQPPRGCSLLSGRFPYCLGQPLVRTWVMLRSSPHCQSERGWASQWCSTGWKAHPPVLLSWLPMWCCKRYLSKCCTGEWWR